MQPNPPILALEKILVNLFTLKNGVMKRIFKVDETSITTTYSNEIQDDSYDDF